MIVNHDGGVDGGNGAKVMRLCKDVGVRHELSSNSGDDGDVLLWW